MSAVAFLIELLVCFWDVLLERANTLSSSKFYDVVDEEEYVGKRICWDDGWFLCYRELFLEALLKSVDLGEVVSIDDFV